jgi:hypothetical protein
MNDIGQSMCVGRILGPGSHDANRHLGQRRNRKIVARQVPLKQAVHHLDAVDIVGIGGQLLHLRGNGR